MVSYSFSNQVKCTIAVVNALTYVYSHSQWTPVLYCVLLWYLLTIPFYSSMISKMTCHRILCIRRCVRAYYWHMIASTELKKRHSVLTSDYWKLWISVWFATTIQWWKLSETETLSLPSAPYSYSQMYLLCDVIW